MKLEPEKESAKKHGLENTHSDEEKRQQTSSTPEAKNTNAEVENEVAKKHGKENTR